MTPDSSPLHDHSPDEERRVREAALDRTLSNSFPASDPLSTDPNPEDESAVPAPAATIPLKIALIGATGFVGSALLDEALRRGHRVTAIARHPETLAPRAGLVAIAADVHDSEGLAARLAGHDAVISAFNPGWKNPRLYDEQVRGTAAIIAAVKRAGVTRLLWVGGAGGLEVRPGVRLVDNPDMPAWVKPGSLATIEALDQLRKEPALDWSFLAPAADMRPGERTGRFRLGGDRLLTDADGHSRISVQDYAVAMLDELEAPAHLRQRFTVAY